MRHLLRLVLCLCLLATATRLQAQTTWTVNLNSQSFSPKTLTINLGDTVKWQWAMNGYHNVESGVGGAFDGAFTSGGPEQGMGQSYSQVFDEALLAAFPMPSNKYNYYCIVHLPAMTGSITVKIPPLVTSYGCLNPSGSLSLVSGTPKIATTFRLGVTNPLGSMAPGSLAVLSFAAAPDSAYPCGLALPGLGLAGGPASLGEILIALAPAPTTLPIALWDGINPAPFDLAVPNSSALIGAKVYFQGAMVDALVGIGLTNGLDVRIGQ